MSSNSNTTTTPQNKNRGFSLPDDTCKQLDWLKYTRVGSYSEIVALAVDALYRKRNGHPIVR